VAPTAASAPAVEPASPAARRALPPAFAAALASATARAEEVDAQLVPAAGRHLSRPEADGTAARPAERTLEDVVRDALAAPAAVLPDVRPAAAGRLVSTLESRGIDAALAGAIVDDVVTHRLPLADGTTLHEGVVRELARRIPTLPTTGPGGRVVAFVGPGGAGKTRCVARLAAAYGTRSGLPVAAVALRAEDRGGQLAALLGPAAIQVRAADEVDVVVERIAPVRDRALVLVDTPGVSPRDDAGCARLGDELARLGADEVHLCVPATIAPEAAAELVDGLRPVGVTHLALTHADETDRLGTVVQLAIASGVPLSYVGEGTAIETGLRPADPDVLARALARPRRRAA